jgi:uncharacterized cupin superfamily protein
VETCQPYLPLPGLDGLKTARIRHPVFFQRCGRRARLSQPNSREALMGGLARANIETPHETRPYVAHGHMDVVTLGDFTLGRGTFEPGWKWSEDVKPIAGTDSCQVRHTGIVVSGRMTVRSDDGTETTVGPGDVVVLEPGHDAWTEGSEPCVMYDTGVAAYAKPT